MIQQKITAIIENRYFTGFITAIILMNAVKRVANAFLAHAHIDTRRDAPKRLAPEPSFQYYNQFI